MAWQAPVPKSIKERLKAGQDYQIELRPKTELHLPQAVRPMGAELDAYSLQSIVNRQGNKLVRSKCQYEKS